MSRRGTEHTPRRARRRRDALHEHKALFYRDDQEYLDGLRRFYASALAAGEPIAAAVPRSKLALAKQAMRGAGDYTLLNMEELGRNPGRIIPAVEKLLRRHEGTTLHYVGEPIWPGRSCDEIREAVRHEALINHAWPGHQVRVLCPYDVEGLDVDVLRSAEETHPTLVRGDEVSSSPRFRATPPPECELPLSAPPRHATGFDFEHEHLKAVRALAAEQAAETGLRQQRVDDFVVVANELASNALVHGDSPRRVSMWSAEGNVVCQVSNRGTITDPLAGRRNPAPGSDAGMGLWIVHHLCHLVEVRSAEHTTVRAHLAPA